MSRYVGHAAHCCQSCLEYDRAERNYEATRATHITVECVKCGAPVVETLEILMHYRGLMRCALHGGRPTGRTRRP